MQLSSANVLVRLNRGRSSRRRHQNLHRRRMQLLCTVGYCVGVGVWAFIVKYLSISIYRC